MAGSQDHLLRKGRALPEELTLLTAEPMRLPGILGLCRPPYAVIEQAEALRGLRLERPHGWDATYVVGGFPHRPLDADLTLLNPVRASIMDGAFAAIGVVAHPW